MSSASAASSSSPSAAAAAAAAARVVQREEVEAKEKALAWGGGIKLIGSLSYQWEIGNAQRGDIE